MSDTEERPGQSEVNTNTSTLKSTSDNVIRYSKDVLLSLHDSPLVCKPENMPPLSSWFGEEAGSPAVAKNMLNSSVVSRSTDKSIVLGPSKTNFASSLYGGLKHTTDSKDNSTSSTKLSSRLRQSEDSIRTHSNNNNRMPRGPNYVGEKGFHYHHHNNRQEKGSGGLERRTSNSYGNQSPHNNRRYHHQHHHNHHQHHHQSDHQGTDRQTMSAGNRREYNRDQRANNRLSHANHNDGQDRGQEHMPEWMDYNPDTKTTTDANDKSVNDAYANDLEAWKSSMKKKEGLGDTTDKQPIKQDALPQEKANGSTSLDKLLDLGSLELNRSSSGMDKIASPLPSLFDSSSTPTSSEPPAKRGSRFAKFFAKREEATQASPPPISSPLSGNTPSDAAQPRSISVNDLFQKPNSSQQQGDANANTTQDAIYHGADAPPKNGRMFFEEDVLQSLGAKKATVSNPELSPADANANAIGFNKVLQILSQPKPAVPTSASSSPDINVNSSPKTDRPPIHGKKVSQNGALADASSTTSSPRAATRQLTDMDSPSMASRESTLSETAAKHKKVNNLFGNNLPTSVLRKMSARSDGRSPSLSSNKSGHSGRFSHSPSDSRNGSPLIGNALSPSTVSMAPTQQYQQGAQSPSHGYHGYSFATSTTSTTTSSTTTVNGNGSQSPHGARSTMNEMMMMNPHQASRNQQPANGYDTMMQQHMFGNGEMAPPPHRLLPPTMHPSSSNMNGPMNRMLSPQFMQQQQTDPSFMPPPPQQMMGMPAMMAPPHLAMRPQGQASNTGNGVPPPPPPFMQPMMPRMPPPPPMGMPQQMYANKNHQWNRQ